MIKKRLDTNTEIQIVAMIARGDSYEVISRALKEKDVSVAISTISAVKKRNIDALSHMQNVIAERELSQSTKLLDKSHQLLSRKLDRALGQEEEMSQLEEQYQNGELNDLQFEVLIKKSLRSELSTAELTSLSKEMFNQSQVEQGKPTSISDNPTQAKENLRTLLEAINRKDEKAILTAIFPDAVTKSA